MVRLLLILVAALSWVPAHAQQSELVGEWIVNSFVVESLQTKERRNVFGEKPTGYLVITPERSPSSQPKDAGRPKQTKIERQVLKRCLLILVSIELRATA